MRIVLKNLQTDAERTYRADDRADAERKIVDMRFQLDLGTFPDSELQEEYARTGLELYRFSILDDESVREAEEAVKSPEVVKAMGSSEAQGTARAQEETEAAKATEAVKAEKAPQIPRPGEDAKQDFIDFITALDALNEMSEQMWAAGMNEKACLTDAQIYSSSSKILGETHPATLKAMYNYALALAKTDRREEAAEILNRYVEIAGKDGEKVGFSNGSTLSDADNSEKNSI